MDYAIMCCAARNGENNLGNYGVSGVGVTLGVCDEIIVGDGVVLLVAVRLADAVIVRVVLRVLVMLLVGVAVRDAVGVRVAVRDGVAVMAAT